MKIAIGSDEAGFNLKQMFIRYLEKEGHEVKDFGCFDESPVLYPDVAVAVAESVADNQYERGLLICGTGIGMAISANKVPGIRAAVCHDPYSTERSIRSNNAQIMCMGARVIGVELAKYLVDIWLKCSFDGGGSVSKVEKIMEYERMYLKKKNR